VEREWDVVTLHTHACAARKEKNNKKPQNLSEQKGTSHPVVSPKCAVGAGGK
jgi:hypothetical protein